MKLATSLHAANANNLDFIKRLPSFDLVAIPSATSRNDWSLEPTKAMAQIEALGLQWYSPWLVSSAMARKINGFNGFQDCLDWVNATVSAYPARDWVLLNESFLGARTRKTNWSKAGENDWVEQLFMGAKQASPDSRFFLKEYRARDTTSHWFPLLDWAASVRDSGVPIDGISIQIHANAVPELPVKRLSQLMARVSALGFALWLDETLSFDLIWNTDKRMPRHIAEQVQAQNYQNWVALAHEHGAEVFGIWHPWDNHTPHWWGHTTSAGLWRGDWSAKPALSQFFKTL